MKAVGVFSVKGGVGKTLISLNVALRLKERGRVGLVDADWDNSNFCQFTNLNEKVRATQDNKLILPEWRGIKVFSPSLMFGREVGVSMTEDRYVQMMSDVMEHGLWGELDYVVIDLPAGSSDIWRGVLTIFGEVLVGDLIVTQPLMTDSLKRGLNLHKYFDIPVVGVVENMSYLTCPHGERIELYGRSDTKEVVEAFGYEYLGEIPFVVELPKKIAEGDVFIESDALDRAVEKVVKSPLPKTSFLQRLKEEVWYKIKTEVEKVLVELIVRLQKDFDFSSVAKERGFTEERPFLLTITDDEGKVVLTRVPLRMRGGKLYVLSKPEKVDFEIATSFRTLARLVMRKARYGDEVRDFDPVQAWTAGDIKAYGTGFTPRALRVVETVLSRSEILDEIARKYGKVLERWI